MANWTDPVPMGAHGMSVRIRQRQYQQRASLIITFFGSDAELPRCTLLFFDGICCSSHGQRGAD